MKKWVYYFSLAIVSVLPNGNVNISQKIFPAVCAVLLGEIYNYTNKGKFCYPELTHSADKKYYTEQVYNKIFQNIPSAQIIEELYKEIFVSLWKKSYPLKELPTLHSSLFREVLFFMMTWRKSFFKLKSGINILATREEDIKSREKYSLLLLSLSIGISKALIEEKIKDKIKENLKKREFLLNRPQLNILFSEMIKIGVSELLITPIYYSIIALLTISCSKIKEQRSKVFGAVFAGKNSVDSFYKKLEETDLFILSEAGNVATRWAFSFEKIINLFSSNL